jgi:hypothetical protein
VPDDQSKKPEPSGEKGHNQMEQNLEECHDASFQMGLGEKEMRSC